MKCPKCNHALPSDSEFCQYCGTRIEKPVTPPAPEAPKQPTPVEEKVVVTADTEEPTQLPDFGKMTPDEALNAILQMQASNTIGAMEANSKPQPDNEGDADFGLVPEKPIFTLALKSVEGEKEYLDKLYTVNGEKIKYNRRGSTSVNGINGMIDIYETYLPSGQPYKTIYINMYGAKRSTKAPAGFTFGKPAARHAAVPAPAPHSGKSAKRKYCSRCGSAIDSKTKKCSGCGKQYFRGLRFTKFSVTVIFLALVIAALSTVCVWQFMDAQTLDSVYQTEISTLKSKNISLEQQVKNKESAIETKNSTIKSLEKKIDELEEELWDNWSKLYFFDTYAVMVNNGSKKYHKYGCSDFDESYFWICNIDAAEDEGYYACSKCH